MIYHLKLHARQSSQEEEKRNRILTQAHSCSAPHSTSSSPQTPSTHPHLSPPSYARSSTSPSFLPLSRNHHQSPLELQNANARMPRSTSPSKRVTQRSSRPSSCRHMTTSGSRAQSVCPRSGSGARWCVLGSVVGRGRTGRVLRSGEWC